MKRRKKHPTAHLAAAPFQIVGGLAKIAVGLVMVATERRDAADTIIKIKTIEKIGNKTITTITTTRRKR